MNYMPSKRPFITIVLFSILLPFSGVLKGQQAHPILSYFSVIAANNNVQLNWAITGGNTCNGIRVQRSTDGVYFETIGEIGGICGSPDVDVPYVYLDMDPASNKTNFYRLELGSQGFTIPLSIDFFPLNDQGYSLIMDINTGKASIYFSNPEQSIAAYRLFSIDGSLLFTGETKDTLIIVDLREFPARLLLLVVSSSAGAFTVKIPNF